MRDAIVFFSDAGRFPAAAFAANRAASLRGRANADVILFTNDLATASANRGRWPFKVAPLTLPPHIKLPPYFYRLFIPEAVGALYRRILYLDDDTYLEDGRAFRLFDIDMAGRAVAGVRDIVIAFGPDADELASALPTAGTKYINSGVLMIDCAAFSRRQILAGLRALAPRITAGLKHLDQTALNLILDGDWLELSPAFNLFAQALGSSLARAFPPAIVHFAGRAKHWATATGHSSASAAMAAFFPASPWPGFFSIEALRPRPAPQGDWASLFGAELRSYVTTTAFADVEAGITRPAPPEWAAAAP